MDNSNFYEFYKTDLFKLSNRIKLFPKNANLYGDRSFCYIIFKNYKEALADAIKSIDIDMWYIQGYNYVAQCYLSLGNLIGLKQILDRMKKMGIPDNMKFESALNNVRQQLSCAKISYENKDYSNVILIMVNSLELLCPASESFKILKAECLALLNKREEAIKIIDAVCKTTDVFKVDALYVKGLCLYHENEINEAISNFCLVLKLAPDHKKALECYEKVKLVKLKKQQADEMFEASKFADAFERYGEALDVDPSNALVNAELYYCRGATCYELKRFEESIENYSKALEINPDFMKALINRARSYAQLEMHEEAARDYENLVKLENSRKNKKMLKEAKSVLERSERKCFYQILGVNKKATIDEIKKAYRKQALLLHPDKHVNSSTLKRLVNETRFKKLRAAYDVLSDTKKRRIYDLRNRVSAD